MEKLSAFQLALAGLVHDIGKFWQRAEGRARHPYAELDKRDFGKNGTHATWSGAYVEQFLPQVTEILGAVIFHHNPQSDPNIERVALADHLASGERVADSDEHPPYLRSIFTQLVGEDGKLPNPDYYLPLHPLALEEKTLFPIHASKADFPTPKDTQAEYADLWSGFVAESEMLKHISDLPTLITSVYHLMEVYTWSVPAAYYASIPDISLFDHSRVVGAIAACLADMDDETVHELYEANRKNKPDAKIPVAYLLEGDISGVQKFIYTITARGATSALRGRSFYLQLLTEAIARYILRGLGLPITNLIYSGGGHFYLVIPPIPEEQLKEIQVALDRIMLTHHQGDLYVALGAAPLTCADFQEGHFGEKWRETGRKVGEAKRQKFSQLGTDQLVARLFSPQGHGGNAEQECQVCHYEGADVKERDDKDQPVRKCELCFSLEKLGKDLRFAQDILLEEFTSHSNNSHRNWQTALAEFGLNVVINPSYDIQSNLSPTRAVWLGLQNLPVWDTTYQMSQSLKCPIARGLRFMVNVAPRKVNYEQRREELATFEDLQKTSTGIKRLGVLRMDVDDLGYLFGFGFRHKLKDGKEKNLSTLARVASLSANLSRYFEGWVGVLCQRINEAIYSQTDSEAIYTIYSGGDDLFIVGAWDQMPLLAQKISQDLTKFAANNLTVHVSGGLSLHGGKEPLYQAAEVAHEALDAAKGVTGKNAFTMFGMSYPWETFAEISNYQQQLVDLAEDNQARSILRLLLELYDEYETTRKTYPQTQDGRKQIIWGPYMWHAVYRLSRLADRSHNKPAIHQILSNLKSNHFQAIEQIALAARWAEALTRE